MIDLTGYKLTFDEEFNALSVSQSGKGTVWADIRESQRLNKNADIGFGQSAFVDAASGIDPFSVGGGALTITATKAPSSIVGPGSFASGLLHTKASFSQTYGYFEMRAATPGQYGAWPAFWMLPADGSWPPELDVMEGTGTTDLYQVIHTAESGTHVGTMVNSKQPTMTSGYHTYGVSWQPDQITFYFDGAVVGTRKTPADMNKAMYLLVDLAVHKNSAVDGTDKQMKVDYVRAYSNAPGATAVKLDTVSSPDGVATGDLHGATSAATPPPVTSPPGDLSHTKSYSKGGVLTGEVFVHADQSKDVYLYAIAGRSYTSEHDSYDAAGALVGVVRTHADGSLDYVSRRGGDGTKTVETYDTKGTMLTHAVTQGDGTKVDQTYKGGVLTSERTTYAAGSDDLSRMKSYIDGVQTREVVTHADASKDIFNLNVANKPYVGEHAHYDPSGKLAFSDQVAKDGSHVTSVFGSGLTATSNEDVADTFRNFGLGSETFVFRENFGSDLVKGFHATGANHDLIEIDTALAASFAELKSMMSASGLRGADTLIAFDAQDQLTLAGVKMKDLDASDFRFVHHDVLGL